MRKIVKIKAWILLFAWITIFVHNIVPHNHDGENSEGCKQFVHIAFTGHSDENRSSRADSQHSDEKVCHLSTFLFHTLSQEILQSYSQRDLNFAPSSPEAEIFIDSDNSFLSDHAGGSSLLRAPPLA